MKNKIFKNIRINSVLYFTIITTVIFILILFSLSRYYFYDIEVLLDAKVIDIDKDFKISKYKYYFLNKKINQDVQFLIYKNYKVDYFDNNYYYKLINNLKEKDEKLINEYFNYGSLHVYAETVFSKIIKLKGENNHRKYQFVPIKSIILLLPREDFSLFKSLDITIGTHILKINKDDIVNYQNYDYTASQFKIPMSYLQKNVYVSEEAGYHFQKDSPFIVFEIPLQKKDSIISANSKDISFLTIIIILSIFISLLISLLTQYLLNEYNSIINNFIYEIKIIKNIIIGNNLNFTVSIIIIAYIAASIFHFFLSSKGYPYNSFLFIPTDRFADFTNMFKIVLDNNPYENGGAYLPFSYLILLILSIFPIRIALLLYIIISSFIIFVFWKKIVNQVFSGDKIKYYILLFVPFISYPYLFNLDRANLEMAVFIFILLSVYYFEKKVYFKSSLFIGFAAAMKLYPIIFAILFVKKGKLKYLFFSLFSSIVIVIFSVIFFKGTINDNLNKMLKNQKEYSVKFMNGINVFSTSGDNIFINKNYPGLGHSCSLYNFIKVPMIKVFKRKKIELIDLFYYSILLIIFLVYMYYLIFSDNELWKKIIIIISIICLFPKTSPDYRLIYYLIPIGLIIKSNKKNDLKFLFILLLITLPKSFYYFNNIITDSGYCDVSISVLFNPLLIMILTFILIYDYFKNDLKICNNPKN
ncbi:MAG: hypothetical protein CVV49_02740 [Spirochaetae bacterium HGW-Spirochaetae-5]|jgi:hypothetical protein|nr:MAG: hypothetical protein CVV49_02740 [Spirochaetae bacterium HGW-Spirochaetae-5]